MFRLGINYNNEPEIFRKGSILYRDVGGTYSLGDARANES